MSRYTSTFFAHITKQAPGMAQGDTRGSQKRTTDVLKLNHKNYSIRKSNHFMILLNIHVIQSWLQF